MPDPTTPPAPAFPNLRWEPDPEPAPVHLAYDHPTYSWIRVGGIHPFDGQRGTLWRGCAVIFWDKAINAQFFITKETPEAARFACEEWFTGQLASGVEGERGEG